MIKKILFLVVSTFNKRDFKRFGIELLKKNGFGVEVWDITNILFPNTARIYTPPDPINWATLRVFEDKNYVLNKLEGLSFDTFIIAILQYSRKFYSIYKAISSSDAKYAFIIANAYPSVESSKKGNLGKILNNLKKLQKDPVNRLLNYSFRKLPPSWLKIKPACLLLAGGEESLKYQAPYDRSTEILWIHTLDYDLYLEEKNKPFHEKSIAVFLDEYLPFHPDFFRIGNSSPIEPDKYYPLLNKFFTLIEQQLNLNVIIAAHPRSHYKNHSDFFGGHRCIIGQTNKLVKESKLVLAHASQSLNFAIIYYKPVIFLTYSELDKAYIEMDKAFRGPLIREMANLFGKKPIYIDKENNIDWNFELKVSKIHYENYRRAYIKTDHSEDLPFWQIVVNRLKKGF